MRLENVELNQPFASIINIIIITGGQITAKQAGMDLGRTEK